MKTAKCLAVALACAMMFISTSTTWGQDAPDEALRMAAAMERVTSKDVTKEWLVKNYRKREVAIPMRDGINLFTNIYEPVDTSTGKPLEGRPIIMERTPYGTAPYGEDNFDWSMTRSMSIYARHKYIIVNQSVRGTFMSEGEFVELRPLSNAEDAGETMDRHVDEATDTYDTAEWLLRNTSTNGNIGVKGVSYPGFYAAMAGLSGHPAIKAVSPQAPVTDWFKGDDMHHNGACFIADEFGFGVSFYRPRRGPTTEWNEPLVDISGDIYEWYKRPLWDILSPVIDSLPFLRECIGHPNFDEFWQARDASLSLRNIRPAVMVVGGLFDAEDCYGALRMYEAIKTLSPSTELYFVEGPWSHGGWDDLAYNHLADSYFGERLSSHFIEEIEYPFFASHLEGDSAALSGKSLAPVNVYPSFAMTVPDSFDRFGFPPEETERDYAWDWRWVSMEEWPPHYEPVSLYLHGNGFSCKDDDMALGADGWLSSVADISSSVTYVSDPSNPVPYYGSATTSRTVHYMAGDQSYCSIRPDVASFVGDVCADSLVLAGPVSVHLSASASSTDADFIVKLIDVRMDGYQMLVRAEVMPARFRSSFRSPEPLVPGGRFSLDWTLNDICHIVLPGHRLMVQVQSSCFPLIAMNPQTFLDNPYKAVASDYVPASITVYGDSSVTLPVLR